MAITPEQRKMRDNPDPQRIMPNRVRKRIREAIVAFGELTPAQQRKAFWHLEGDQLVKRTRPAPPRQPEPEPEL